MTRSNTTSPFLPETAPRDVGVPHWVREAPEGHSSSRPGETETRGPARPPVLVPVVIPPLPLPQERFELLQQFEGTVLEVVGDEFHARFRDLTVPTNPDESAWFALADVMDDDVPLVKPGAMFYWRLGYRILRSGTKERASGLRFRRLPAWTRSERARAEALAAEWERLLGPHEPD